MKILVAGPLPDSKKNGGVAVFTKNLIREMQQKEYDVQFFSVKGKILTPKNLFNFSRKIKKFKPDFVFSSLQYSILLLFIKTPSLKVHFLHGFTNQKSYSYIKFALMNILDKLTVSRFNFVLANSSFTRMINKEIYNLRSDGVFQIGLSDEELKKISFHNSVNNKRNDVIFVGRLVPAKNVDLIIKSFKSVADDCQLQIIGSGSSSNCLKMMSKDDKRIKFLGFKDHGQIFEYYQKSKVFISLNPSEPYGIVYLEALLNGNYIIAPNTGGQVEFLKKFPERCSLVDINNESDISKAIEKGLHQNVGKFDVKTNISKFSYAKTLSDIEDVIFNGC